MVGNHIMNTTVYFLIMLVVLTVTPAVSAAEIVVQADRNPVGLDETFQLTYSTSGDVDGDPDFLPLTPFVEIINRSQRSNISVINGLYQSTKSWTLTVMPKQRGTITLPEIAFGRDKSPPYELLVKSAVVRQDEQTEMFTRIDFDQTKLYVNQQLVVTHTLFSATNLTSYDLGELKFSGVDAFIEPLGDARQYTKTVGQTPFLVIEQRYAVFPLASGMMKLDTIVSRAEQAMSRGSFYLPFGGAPKVLRARAGGRQIEVLPPPATANMNPWLPAVSLELSERWDRTPVQFVVGEPLTRTLSLKAEGVAAAQLPDLSKATLDGVKLYPDQPLLNDIKNDAGITGYSVQKVAFIPVRTGRIELPAIEVAWWNTRANQREVAILPAQTIEVLPGENAPAQTPAPAVPATEKPMPAASAVEPAQAPPQSPLLAVTSNASPWFFVSMLLSFGWLMTLLAWYIKSGKKLDRRRAKPSDSDKHKLASALSGLRQACDAGDALACRSAVLDWARLYYRRPQLTGVRDIAAMLQGDAAQELTNIDAVLYGAAQHTIDFNLIKKGVDAAMADRAEQNIGPVDGLEPLYRS